MTATREIRLPALSATMEEATLLEWKVAPGDEVKEGEPIAEVSTDKVDMDLESPFPGVIRELLVDAGDAVPLGGVLAMIETEADDFLGDLGLDGPREAASPVTSAPSIAASGKEPALAADQPTSGIIPASPPARKLARELGVDLAAITPTGARGQVTPSDVRRFAADPRPGTVSAPAVAAPAPAQITQAPSAAPTAAVAPSAAGADEAKRLTVRRATTEIMGRSAEIPQFTLYRTLILDRAASRKGGRSWTTELVRALTAALRAHPELNARWDDASRITVPWETVGVGLAVDRPGVGLVVATVADTDTLDPGAADQAVRAAADRAKIGKLRPEDMTQASITLSNLGGLGVERFNALLFPPQAAILSAGTIAMRPVATSDGALKAALTLEVGLTVDHRVADGADGARFLQTFAELAEG